MPVELFGYSERGMVNALCDDIHHSGEAVSMLESFLGWCSFPLAGIEPDFKGIEKATLHVEQSFSDFGDLDLLILLDYPAEKKRAILAEAKVSTDTGSPKRIGDQWNDFLSYLGGDGSKTSSLFVQLYRKARLIEQVGDLNRTLPPDAVARRWSLGNNRVVRNAAGRLTSYCKDPWYLAIVPDRPEVVAQFFNDHLNSFNPEAYGLGSWDFSRIGFITWPEIHLLVGLEAERWPQLTRNFDWNRHQIYPLGQQPVGGQPVEIPTQGFRVLGERVVYVAVQSANNCRVVPVDDLGESFPRGFLVPTGNLGAEIQPERPVDPGGLRPVLEAIHQWGPPLGEDPRPPRGGPVPVPPLRVIVRVRGWETSAVRQVDESGREFGDLFHVFNHHLQR